MKTKPKEQKNINICMIFFLIIETIKVKLITKEQKKNKKKI